MLLIKVMIKAYSLFTQNTPQVCDDFDDDEADNENFSDDTANIKEVPKLIKLYVFFLLTFQSTFRISDAAISVLLAFLSTFFGIVARNYNVDPTLKLLFEQIPNSIKAARKLVDGNRDNLRSMFVAQLALVLTPGSMTPRKPANNCVLTSSFQITLNIGIGNVWNATHEID